MNLQFFYNKPLIFYAVIVIFFISFLQLFMDFRLYLAERKVFSNINEKAVRKLIKTIKTTIIINKPRVWNKLRSVFYYVNNSNIISFDLKLELRNILLRKGCNLGFVSINRNNDSEIEEKIRKSGEEGENKVSYNLRWLPKEYRVLKNIRLNNAVDSQEFDSIVIGPNGIFHLEIKNYGGKYGCKIKINSSGDWIKETNNSEVGIENPSFQVDRHEKVLQNCLNIHFGDDIYKTNGIIVLSNEKTIIEGAENSDIPVIKADKIVKFITEFNNGLVIYEDEIQKIYEKIKLIKI